MKLVGTLFFILVSQIALSSEIAIPHSAHSENRVDNSGLLDQYPGHPRNVELEISSWSPSGFDLEASTSSKSGFERTSMPSIGAYLNFSNLGDAGFWRFTSPEVGLSFTEMERTGKMRYFGSDQVFTQSAYVLGGHIGLHFEFPQLSTRYVVVWQSIGFMPSAVFVSNSVLKDASIENAYPFYGRIGARIGTDTWPVKGMLGFEGTTASITEKDISGWGAFGGIQSQF